MAPKVKIMSSSGPLTDFIHRQSLSDKFNSSSGINVLITTRLQRLIWIQARTLYDILISSPHNFYQIKESVITGSSSMVLSWNCRL